MGIASYHEDPNKTLISPQGENMVLQALAGTENIGAQDQANIIIKCKKHYDSQRKKRDKFGKLFEYYNDRQEQHFLDDVMRPLMGRDENGSWEYDKMVQENVTPLIKINNLVTKFVNKQATLYDEPPQREIVDDVQATERYNELATQVRLDAVFQVAERYQKLFRSSFLRPVVRTGEEGGYELDLDVMLPTFFYALPNPMDTTKAAGYYWLVFDPEFPDDPMRATWYYIDRGLYFWWSYQSGGAQAATAGVDKVAYISENGDGKKPEGNPLGEPGIVRLASDWVCGDVIPHPGDSLLNFQDSVNLVETMKQNSLIFQGFPLLHLRNFDVKDKDGKSRRMNIGPWRTLITQDIAGDSPSSVSWVSPATNIEQFIRTLEHDIDAFMLAMSVPKNLIMDSATSGTALAERNRDIKELRKSYINQYQAAEQEVYRIVAKWANLWLKDKLPEDGVVVIKYHEPEIRYSTEAEEMAAWKLKIELGAASILDYLAEKNPDLDKDGLADKLAEIRKVNGDTGGVFSDIRARSGGIINSAVNRALGQSE